MPPDAVTAVPGSEPVTAWAPVLRSAGIVGLSGVPATAVVSSAQIGERIGVDEAWILRRTGISERRRAAPGETTAGLAAQAGAAALADAGIGPLEVDLVLVATMSPDQATPNVAPVVADQLGLLRAGAQDIGAACSGFMGALVTGAAHVESGRADTVLIIGADRMSSLIDPDDRRTAPLFGDGAGAVVLRAGAGSRIGPTTLGADGSLRDTIAAPLGGTMTMDGHVTFQAAVSFMIASALLVCERAGVTPADLALFVPHQANSRITVSVGEKLGLRADQVVDVISRYGNTSTASIPLALTSARDQGLLPERGLVLLAGVGAGFTWGAALIDWEAPR